MSCCRPPLQTIPSLTEENLASYLAQNPTESQSKHEFVEKFVAEQQKRYLNAKAQDQKENLAIDQNTHSSSSPSPHLEIPSKKESISSPLINTPKTRSNLPKIVERMKTKTGDMVPFPIKMLVKP